MDSKGSHQENNNHNKQLQDLKHIYFPHSPLDPCLEQP